MNLSGISCFPDQVPCGILFDKNPLHPIIHSTKNTLKINIKSQGLLLRHCLGVFDSGRRKWDPEGTGRGKSTFLFYTIDD